jgi:hypothetical protein
MKVESQKNCGLRIADCGLKKRENRKSGNPKSETRNPKSKRSALSLTEVLIAMGILTLGLLGVASVFPVGSFYIQKADTSDRASAIAQSVMNDLMARGMLNPRSWYVMVPPSAPSGVPATTFPSDGLAAPVPHPVNVNTVRTSFTRSLGLALNEAIGNQPAAATDKTIVARQFGSAFVIDPLGISAMGFKSGVAPSAFAHAPAALFPAMTYNAFGYYANSPSWSTSAWAPWYGGAGGASASNIPLEWPVRRVTFRQTSTGYHASQSIAEHYFRGSDDLVVDLPSRDDRPATQKWELSPSGTPAVRQWTGDYSWIVTVVPATNAARDGMGSSPEAFDYDVSVVVFYKRVLPDDPDSTYVSLSADGKRFTSAMGANERAVKATVLSSGLNGGEMLLTDWGDFYDSAGVRKWNAFDQLRTGQWIMICGPHPNSNVNYSTTPPSGEPRLSLNWYQVVSIDKEGKGIVDPVTGDAFDPNYNRVVVLRGPQWPWQPTSDKADAANDLCAAICAGAVAVHTKTMRLEGRNSAWSVPAGGVAGGDGGFGGGGGPTVTTTPWYPF